MITKKYSISVCSGGYPLVDEMFISKTEFERQKKTLNSKVVINKDNGEDEYDYEDFSFEDDVVKRTCILQDDEKIKITDSAYSMGMTCIHLTLRETKEGYYFKNRK